MNISKKIKSILLLPAILFAQICFAQFGEEGTAVTLHISPKVCPSGQPVILKGNILVNDKTQSFSISITEPSGAVKTLTGNTDIKGDYNKTFSETQANGWYSVQTIAADNKGKITDSFFVSTPQGVVTAYQNRINALITQSVRNLNLSLQHLEQMPATNGLEENRQKLRTAISRLGEMKQRANECNTHFNRLMQEIQPLPAAQQGMQRHHEALSGWVQQADEVLPRMEQQQQQYQNISKICERINGVIELCGLASWVMNFQGSLAKIMLNISSDKVLPGAVDRIEWTGGDAEKEAKKFAINETQKTMTAASLGIAELADFIKKGVIGDVIQFIGKELYAKRCVDLKGPANAQFSAKMYNQGKMYWSYGVNYNGTLTLRYEKTADLNKPVEITGEFEGYKSKYDFWEKIENVEPLPAGLKIIKRITKKPIVVNATAISNDLGLAGRAVTPGMYRVKVKGKFLDNKLTLEVVSSPFDYTEKIEMNKLFLVTVNAALPIPLIKRFDFPISKARAAFVVGLGDKQPLNLSQQDDKLLLKTNFTNNRTVGTGGDINLETKIDLNLKN